MHALAIDETEQAASLELARSVIASFGLARRAADAIVAEVAASSDLRRSQELTTES